MYLNDVQSVEVRFKRCEQSLCHACHYELKYAETTLDLLRMKGKYFSGCKRGMTSAAL